MGSSRATQAVVSVAASVCPARMMEPSLWKAMASAASAEAAIPNDPSPLSPKVGSSSPGWARTEWANREVRQRR